MATYTTQEAAEFAADAESRLMLVNGSVIEFDGQNCAGAWEEGEACAGWDGNDRRCECGNRRVGWSFYQANNGVWHYYAEAY